MNILASAIIVPLAFALLCLTFKRIAKWLALAAAVINLVLAILVFLGGEISTEVMALHASPLSSSIFLAAAFLALLIIIYSFKFMEGRERLSEYYAYILVALTGSAGVVFATDYLTLFVFWGILGAILYFLIGIGGENSAEAAQKSLMIIGGADAFMILGIAIVWLLTRTLQIGYVQYPLDEPIAVMAFLCLMAGAFAKAGVMPFHAWIPDSSEAAPATVMAFLPASLDKLLGVYFIFRICTEIFVIEPNSAVSIFLLAAGSFTIISAVLAALVQHNLKKLLAFHAVSQVGYMVIGIGTGLPVGIAGGLFHMFNNAIYKTALFLSSGSIEQKAGTTDLEQLGGLAKFMPLTFGAFLIAALAISGVPPLNGFVSKWLIYQAVIDLRFSGNLWVVWLAAAMFGSAFTLASFIKLSHAVFLGQWADSQNKIKEASWQMWLPTGILAAACLIFGVFAFTVPLKYLIIPSVEGFGYEGAWEPVLAAGLLIAGLLAGWLIYVFTKASNVVYRPPFIGGEVLPIENKVSGVDFYDSVKGWGPLEKIYGLAEEKWFDVYDICGRISLAISGLLGRLQNGQAHTYLAWMLAGGIVVIFILMR